ncbi:MAG: hypothetical protein ABR616_07815 [Dermatophilaceae bacterium]
MHYQVTLHYSDDGHPALDASVTAAGDGPGGAELQPVALDPTDPPGTYQARVEFPAAGAWEVRFSALLPTASLGHFEVLNDSESPVPVSPPTPAPPTSTSGPNEATAPTLSSEEEDPGTIGNSLARSTADVADAADVDSMSQSGIGLGVGALAFLALGAVLILAVAQRRRRRTPV